MTLRMGVTTLEEYLSATCTASADASKARECAEVVRAVAEACAAIDGVVRRAGLNDVSAYMEGKNGSVNVHGEEQQALDDHAHVLCVDALVKGSKCRWIASEESEEVVAGDVSGRFACVFDPLDGSSNIECGVGVGTIFGVVEVDPSDGPESVYVRPGRDMKSVGYVLYGSSTVLVLSFDADTGVCAFTLDTNRKAFVLTKIDITIPDAGNVYSVNQANFPKWNGGTKKYFDECVASGKSLRYVGSMVADVHRTLLYGGTFHYPADDSHANGKLRAVYECFPMSAIVERAGGKAIQGAVGDVLDFVPKTAHCRVPIHIGSARDIERLASLLGDEEN